MTFDIEALRNDTRAIIDVNPCDIVFLRSVKQEDDYGNITHATSELPVQRVRIAEIAHNEQTRIMQVGMTRVHIVNITAEHDADIMAGDKFDFLGDRYVVDFMRKMTIGGYTLENCYKQSGEARELTEETE